MTIPIIPNDYHSNIYHCPLRVTLSIITVAEEVL